jgi:hypothetical protein
VTRQFLYLRGPREFFVIFDRVEATKPEFARHFFLHVPTEPKSKDGASPVAEPPGSGRRSRRAVEGPLAALSPDGAAGEGGVVVRGGKGKEAWGHPLEPTAQYNHEGPGRLSRRSARGGSRSPIRHGRAARCSSTCWRS